MRARAIFAAFLAAALAGCGSTSVPHPCADVTGACVELEVRSDSPLQVDTIRFTASGTVTGMRDSVGGKMTGLPVFIAVALPGMPAGTLMLHADGLLGGGIVGSGDTSITLAGTANEHVKATITLGGINTGDGGPGDGGDIDGNVNVGTCSDGMQNGNETDKDCGGRCGATCAVGKMCGAGGDCTTTICNGVTHLCGANSCDDGVMNNNETDVDCGGTMCNPCGGAKKCVAPTDCLSNVCGQMYCQLLSGLGGTTGINYPRWVDGPAVPPTLAPPITLAGRGHGSAISTADAIWLIAGNTYSSGTGQTRPTGTVQVLPFTATGPATAWVAGDPAGGGEQSISVIYMGKVWQFGGFGALNPNNTVNSHPLTPFMGSTWTQETSMPMARGYSPAVGPDNRVWLFGDIAQIQSFAPPGDWKMEGQMPVRQGVSASVMGQTIYVMAGGGGTTTDAFNTTTKTFTAKRAGITGRTWAVAVPAPDGRIYLIGGDNAATARVVEAYTPENDTWTAVATLQGDHGVTAATIGPDGRLWVISGADYGGTNVYSPRVEIYGPTVTMTPPMGPRGTMVTVNGGNFASSTATRVYWGNPKAGGVLVGQGSTSGAGNLPGINVTIPATGAGPLYVIDQKSEYPALGRFTIQ